MDRCIGHEVLPQPAKVVIQGDLADAQRIYTAVRHLDPPPVLEVHAERRKPRRELLIVEIPDAELTKIVTAKDDALPVLVEKKVNFDTLIMLVAVWDMIQQNPKLTEHLTKDPNDLGQHLPSLEKFYGVGQREPGSFGEEFGWKQLENRGVKVVYPTLQKE